MSGDMTTIMRGESVVVSSAFRRGVIFSSAPTWILYDWNDNPMLTGVATPGDGNRWEANITLPANVSIPDGAQPLVLEYTVTDGAGVEHILQRQITVVDDFPDDATVGLIWYGNQTSLSDTVLLPKPASAMNISLNPGYGTGPALATSAVSSPTAVSSTGRGSVYNWSLTGLPALANSASGYYPYQLEIDVTYTDGTSDVLIRPVYGATRLVLSRLNSMRRFLDKGRFTDIDPRLQWADEELIHFLFDGVQYINNFGGAQTFWTVDNLPSPMDSSLLMAAQWQALNARYQAEGYNSFNFNSGGVDLQFDRTQYIATKMDEIMNALNAMLQGAKSAAVRQFGAGTPAAGISGTGSIGSLGISVGPMLNRTRRPGVGWGITGRSSLFN